MPKEKRLISVIQRRPVEKLLESYPCCILEKKKEYEGPEGAKKAVGDIMTILQSISEAGEDFYNIVNKEDLSDIAMFFSEKRWYLGMEKKEIINE